MAAKGKDPLDFIKVHLASVMDIEFKTDPNGNEKLPHADVYAKKFYATMFEVALENGSKTARDISAAFKSSIDNETDFDLEAEIAKHYITIAGEISAVNKSLDVLIAKKMFKDDEVDPDKFLKVMAPFENEIKKVMAPINHGVNSPSIAKAGLPNQALNALLKFTEYVAGNVKAIKDNVPELWRDDAYRYEIYADKFHQTLYQIALENESPAAIKMKEKFVKGLGDNKDFSLEAELSDMYKEIEETFNSRNLKLNELVAKRLFKDIDVDDFENAMTDRTALTPLESFKAHVADNKASIKEKQPELRRKAVHPADDADAKAQARYLLRSKPEKRTDPSGTIRKHGELSETDLHDDFKLDDSRGSRSIELPSLPNLSSESSE